MAAAVALMAIAGVALAGLVAALELSDEGAAGLGEQLELLGAFACWRPQP